MTREILKQKLENIQTLVEDCLRELQGEKREPKRISSDKTEESVLEDIALKIANKAKDCEESDRIQTRILDKRDMEGRILLCFYISFKYFENHWLTTGSIEKITSELGVKIDLRNVSSNLKSIRQYLESGAVRKKGQPTPYRINRKGVKRFEEIINKA